MDQKRWQRWVMQTATNIEDLNGVIEDTGIEIIDREHLRLVEYILEMGESINDSSITIDSKKLAMQKLLFKRFLTAIKAHFKTEEYFIEKYALKGKEVQQKEHQKILQEYNVIISDFKEGILSTFQTVRIDLISELIEHINVTDYNTFLLKNFMPVLKASESWDDVSEIIKSTGLPFVDREHKVLTVKFIEFKNYLLTIDNRIRTKSQKENILELLSILTEYTEQHFDHEEEFLKRYKLNGDNQAEQHGIFLNEVYDLTRKIEKNHMVDLAAFVEYLFSWWVNHINGIDYVEFHYTRIADPVFSMAKTSDDFSWLIRKTDIEIIDDEHGHLIELLLKLNFKKKSGQDFDVKSELSVIANYAALHFNHEEKIMKEKGLEGWEIHAEAHRKILTYLGDAMKHVVSGRSQISPAFFKRIMRWWVDHTNGMDYDTFVLNRKLI